MLYLFVKEPVTKIKSFIAFIQGGLYYKTFYDHNCLRIIISQSVCHCRSLSPQSNIIGQGQKLTRVEYFTRLYSNGRLQALPENIRPGWKLIALANALVYYDMTLIMTVKSFIVLAPSDNLKKYLKISQFVPILKKCF